MGIRHFGALALMSSRSEAVFINRSDFRQNAMKFTIGGSVTLALHQRNALVMCIFLNIYVAAEKRLASGKTFNWCPGRASAAAAYPESWREMRAKAA
jgi:hypothetical protein